MPIHFPGLHHHHNHDKKDKDKTSPEMFIPTSSPRRSSSNLPSMSSSPAESPDVEFSPAQRTATFASTVSSSSSTTAPPSILKKKVTVDDTGSDYTNSTNTSGSAFLSKRLSGLNFDRTDTISSVLSDEDDREERSTPGTSVSSLGAQCPLPPVTTPSHKFPFVTLTLSGVSTLSFIALPGRMRPVMLDAVRRAWKKGISKSGEVDYMPELMKKHQEKGCENGAVWEIVLKDNAWLPESKDRVSSKRIMINILTEFAREGYNLTSSFRTSAKDSGKDTLMFLRGEPDPDPIFFAVAFHSSDRIWIIDAEADVGEALEKGIREWWLDGIRDARVRERHCREIRLRGNPWTAHHHSALISARCIHLAIMKTITHCKRGYDYAGSVQMADIEEGEMAVSFYRRKWGPARAIWSMDH